MAFEPQTPTHEHLPVPPSLHRLSNMRAFLLAPIALVAAGPLSFHICHAKRIPDRFWTVVSAAQLERRSPFHAITSSLVVRTEVLDLSIIPDQVGQTPMNRPTARCLP